METKKLTSEQNETLVEIHSLIFNAFGKTISKNDIEKFINSQNRKNDRSGK